MQNKRIFKVLVHVCMFLAGHFDCCLGWDVPIHVGSMKHSIIKQGEDC